MNKKIIKKKYLNEVLKKKSRSFDVRDIVKWCVIFIKLAFEMLNAKIFRIFDGNALINAILIAKNYDNWKKHDFASLDCLVGNI